MANCPQINNTNKASDAIAYVSTNLPCSGVNTCDGLNTVLNKFNTIICSVTESVNTLTEDITNLTEDIMIISEEIENINSQLFECCPICDFTGTADELPDFESICFATTAELFGVEYQQSIEPETTLINNKVWYKIVIDIFSSNVLYIYWDDTSTFLPGGTWVVGYDVSTSLTPPLAPTSIWAYDPVSSNYPTDCASSCTPEVYTNTEYAAGDFYFAAVSKGDCPTTTTTTTTELPCVCMEITISQEDLDDATGNTLSPSLNNKVAFQTNKDAGCGDVEISQLFSAPGKYRRCIKSSEIGSIELFYKKDNNLIYYPATASTYIVSSKQCATNGECTPI
jgi:hypothetical protein